MTTIPVQPSKVQAPPLRDETLSRERLLSWLSVKVHNRIVLVVAEAGYGKTTLLADFSRRTRVRMLWYRLDLGDRDPVVFLHHVVGAVRVRLPEACAAAASLLAEVGPAGPGLNVIVDALVRGLSELPDDATALVLDDYHVIEDSPDIRPIIREILTRAPEQLTIVIASRRPPVIPIARLRVQGEVAELRTADLRFDEEETERLFRETYSMPLEPGVASELARRTEGWAASLQLVQSAIRGRSTSEVRAFVRSLTGAEGDLYDYLAEEVVGDLAEELQLFLMRTSVLETVDPEFGAVASGFRPDDVRSLIEDGERVGLLARRGSIGRHVVRAHPLVRDFLLARLRRGIGEEGIAAIHRRVAAAAEPLDWALAGRHYRAAGDGADVRRVLHGAIDSVLSSGAYGTAAALLDPADEDEPDAVTLVIRSREAMQRGDTAAAVDLATRATAAAPGATFAALTSMTARFAAGDLDAALRESREISRPDVESTPRELGRAIELLLASSVDMPLASVRSVLEDLVRKSEGPGLGHFRGVALLNLAYLLKAKSETDLELRTAGLAVEALEGTSKGIELVSARLIKAWALAESGDLNSARAECEVARSSAPTSSQLEVAYESASLEAMYGSLEHAREALDRVSHLLDPTTDHGEQGFLALILVEIRAGNLERAEELSSRLQWGRPRTSVAFEACRRLVVALLRVSQNSSSAEAAIEDALSLAIHQGADFVILVARFLRAMHGTTERLNAAYREVRVSSAISMCAEIAVGRLDDLDDRSLERITTEARLRPERWRTPVRSVVRDGKTRARLRAAEILEQVGSREDVPLLRSLAKAARPRSATLDLGRALARRLAEPVFVEDLGRVEIMVGTQRIEGSALRRKVLALLCLLLTRPRFAATREEVIERLWPDLDPRVALNSLNQTVYFLRRVFEKDYKETLSPGYVEQDTETVWLDRDLVGSRSAQCRSLLHDIPPAPTPDQVWAVALLYTGKFALEFAYEDWASDYRGSLHAAYLRVVEGGIKADLDSGEFDRGISIAERAIEVEPESDDLQASLIRLYRLAGVHAAAAEKYTQYRAALKELGLEVPQLGDV